MVASKYRKKYKNFDIVIPEHLNYFFDEYNDEIVGKLKKYYSNIKFVGKDESFYLLENEYKNDIITFRSDILPVPYKEMTGLIENSVKDILLTGDQSITDALSCCSDKNIFYQAFVIAGDNMDVAREFLNFLKTPNSKNILRNSGFIVE